MVKSILGALFLLFAQQLAAAANEPVLPQVTLTTARGDIVVELYGDRAPLSTANFLKYVDAGFYDGLVFHRVIPGFMVQAGGYDAQLNERKPGLPVNSEAANGAHNTRGTIAMARTDDPDSADSQFFINLIDNTHLDRRAGQPGYTVFGRVISGMDVVDVVAGGKTDVVNGMEDVPAEPIVILHARRVP